MAAGRLKALLSHCDKPDATRDATVRQENLSHVAKVGDATPRQTPEMCALRPEIRLSRLSGLARPGNTTCDSLGGKLAELNGLIARIASCHNFSSQDRAAAEQVAAGDIEREIG